MIRKPKPHCALEGCNRPALARGLCQVHYQRQRRTGRPGAPEISPRTGDCVRVELVLPLKAWERLAGQGRPFAEVAREALVRASARMPAPLLTPKRGDLRSRELLEVATVLQNGAVGTVLTTSGENLTTSHEKVVSP